MAKEHTDRTTIDLFEHQKRPGRPKTNPLPREVQLKVNKRNQLKRDKANGLKRVEVKLHQSLLDQLDEKCAEHSVNRSALIASILEAALSD
ncbi:LexA regulated protein [Corallincola platygyrae]|uniref:LexA regulated protein n=1 Tax=Corallincola platygyrae TaxID=1193278 RepID=A0ABW4XJY5_9GAMM